VLPAPLLPGFFVGARLRAPAPTLERPYLNAGSLDLRSIGADDPRLVERERAFQLDKGTSTMVRVPQNRRARHGQVVARVEGYELIPNYAEREERNYRASQSAQEAFEARQKEQEALRRQRVKARKFGSYVQPQTPGLGSKLVVQAAQQIGVGGGAATRTTPSANGNGSAASSPGASAVVTARQRSRMTAAQKRREAQDRGLSSGVGDLTTTAVVASPKSVHALEGARALLEKGVISQDDYKAIEAEVWAIVAAEEQANAVTYGGTRKERAALAKGGGGGGGGGGAGGGGSVAAGEAAGDAATGGGEGGSSTSTTSVTRQDASLASTTSAARESAGRRSAGSRAGSAVRRGSSTQEIRQMQQRQNSKPSLLLRAFVGTQQQRVGDQTADSPTAGSPTAGRGGRDDSGGGGGGGGKGEAGQAGDATGANAQ
jgi:hypothetical protein